MLRRSISRVLVVDDSADEARWLVRLFEECGVKATAVDTAASLAEALAALEARAYDIAIVDWELPDGQGVELSERVYTRNPCLPIVITTGHEQPEQGVAAVGRGATDFVPKSDLTRRSLSRICAQAMARARLERQVLELRAAEVAAARREREARVAAELALAQERRARVRITRLQVLSSALAAATTTRDVARAIMEHAAIFEGARAVSLYALEADALLLQDSSGFTNEALAVWARIPLAARTPLSDAARRGEVVRLDDLETLETRYPTASGPRASWVAFPLASENVTIGVLGLRFDEGQIPDSEGLDYVLLVTHCAAQALHRARLYESQVRAAEFEQRLLAVIGHDLRTPLAAIQMVAFLLGRKGADPSLVRRLERSAGRVNALIDDVLDRSGTRNRGAVERPWISKDAAAVTSDQLDELRAAFPHVDLQLEVTGARFPSFDESRFGQVVANLVRNAIQHGEATTPVVVRLASDGSGTTLSVHNRGNPIDPDDLPALFGPFRRGRNAAGKGVGLGLFIVHEAVALMGGEVSVTSDASGTTFNVHFAKGSQDESTAPASDATAS